MDICPKCNGTLIDPISGGQCSCVIRNALKSVMHPILLAAKPAPKQGMFPAEHLRQFKSVICTTPKAAFASLAKYYFSLEFIINNSRYTHLYSTARELSDSFLIGDYEAEKPYLESDFLILSIHNDPENSYMAQMIPYVVQQRAALGKTTWINVDQKTYQLKDTKYHGMIAKMLDEQIVKYISTFKPADWK